VTSPDGDGLAWYRHFWPWFIVALLGISMTGSLATVVLAYRGRDALVRDDWYKDGVAINRSLERLEVARTRGIRADMRFDPDHERVSVTLEGEGTAALAELSLHLSHATQVEHDRRVTLARVGPGRFEARLAELPIGRFHASLEPWAGNADAGVWRLKRPFYYPGAPTTVALEPGT
jgi:hypothetical protein